MADHTSKLRLMFITQAALMFLALALGLLVDLELIKIWDFCLIVFLSGTVMAFDIPARQAFIVELVGKPDLPNAIALNSTLFNVTRVMGPAVGGRSSPRGHGQLLLPQCRQLSGGADSLGAPDAASGPRPPGNPFCTPGRNSWITSGPGGSCGWSCS